MVVTQIEIVVGKTVKKMSEPGLYIVDETGVVEIEVEEWTRLFPDEEPVRTSLPEFVTEIYFDTYFDRLWLNTAMHYKLYTFVRRPESIGISKVGQLVVPFQETLENYIEECGGPDNRKTYEENCEDTHKIEFFAFLEKYLKACKDHPDAEVMIYE